MDAIVVTPAPVTVAGRVVAVTGGPWRIGSPALVRVAAIVGVSVDAVLTWDGMKWQPAT